jgi:hypothetical protein
MLQAVCTDTRRATVLSIDKDSTFHFLQTANGCLCCVCHMVALYHNALHSRVEAWLRVVQEQHAGHLPASINNSEAWCRFLLHADCESLLESTSQGAQSCAIANGSTCILPVTWSRSMRPGCTASFSDKSNVKPPSWSSW